VIEVLSGEGILSKQEAPSVRPGHGMDRDNLRGIKNFRPRQSHDDSLRRKNRCKNYRLRIRNPNSNCNYPPEQMLCPFEFFFVASRCVERSALRGDLVVLAEDWKWGSLFRWPTKPEPEQKLLSPKPIA
jgi:hypothetical protein